MARITVQVFKATAIALMVGLSTFTAAEIQDGIQAGNTSENPSPPRSGSTEEFRQLVQEKAEDHMGQAVGRVLTRQQELIETAVGLKPDLQPETAAEAFRQSLLQTGGDLLADVGKHYTTGALNGELLAYDQGKGINIGAAGLAEAAQAAFQFSNFAALQHMEIEAGFSNGKPKLSLLTVIPLNVGRDSSRQDDTRHNWFTQLSYDMRSRDQTDRHTFNAGLGYRYLTPNEKWLYGADIELEGALPNHPEWRGFLRAYHFNRYEDESDLNGLAASIEYSPFPALTIKTEVEDNNVESTHLNFGAQFKYRFGMPWKEQLKAQNVKQIFADLKNRRYEKVRRENIIRIQKRQHPDVVGTISLNIGANNLTGTGGNRTAAVGLTLLFGTTITVEDTVADIARLNIRFGDGALLEIGDGSTVRIEEGRIRLITGVLRYTSNGGAITNLITPNASVQLLGTVVELLDEGGNIATRVTQGSIAMTVAGSTLNRAAISAACSTGAAPIACTTGNAQYDALDTAVNNRLAGGTSAPVVAIEGTMIAINAAGVSYRMGCTDIPPGGGTNDDASCRSNEQPEHTITFVNNFEVSKHEVTFDDWMECVNDVGNPLACTYTPNDRGFGTGSKPVINVSYNDITTQYLPWLNAKTGKSYRLPTEAEWEYVTRAGTSTVYNVGDTITCGAPGAGDANCSRAVGQTTDVGSYAANAFGLFDTHGNVYEWLEDTYASNYSTTPTDGSAQTGGSSRVVCGGSWYNDPIVVRSAGRGNVYPTFRNGLIGFRLARTQ